MLSRYCIVLLAFVAFFMKRQTCATTGELRFIVASLRAVAARRDATPPFVHLIGCVRSCALPAVQAYVALSRVRISKGVALESLVRESITKVDARVLAEYERLGIPFGGAGLNAPVNSDDGDDDAGVDAMERDVGSDEVPSGGVDGTDVQPNVGVMTAWMVAPLETHCLLLKAY